MDELNYKEANLITSGHSNTCGTSLKKPVGVTTILGNQGQDPVNTDPDKASEAYEGLGPTPDLLRQTLEVVSVDNVPVGRKPSEPKAPKTFKFKKRGRINSKENLGRRIQPAWRRSWTMISSIRHTLRIRRVHKWLEKHGAGDSLNLWTDRPTSRKDVNILWRILPAWRRSWTIT